MQHSENVVKVVIIIAILALVIALINSLIMLYGLYKKKVRLIEVVVLVLMALIVPWGFAVLAKGLSSRGGLDNALITWSLSGFALMVAMIVFLSRKINKKD